MEPGRAARPHPQEFPHPAYFGFLENPDAIEKWCASGIDCGEAVEISMLHLDCLSNGIELGPTTPVNLAPGQVMAITLPASSQPFTSWSAHPEVG